MSLEKFNGNNRLMKQFTIKDFFNHYTDDDVCLQEIFDLRYREIYCCASCKTDNPKFYRIKKRKCFECGKCGHHIYPLAGTIMEGSTTPLVQWFFAIYLFASSKNGVSAKELERQLGVTYKCAWRIGHKIRELMGSGSKDKLSGTVEIDESLFGGRVRGGKRGWGAENKVCLFGIIERGGKVRVIPIDNRQRETIFPIIEENIEKGSTVNTDEFKTYATLTELGYEHKNVVHSKYQWAQGDAYTNSIEGYWSNLKKSIFGTHTYVSPKHLPNYLGEFDFRHNNRKMPCMFKEIVNQIK